MARRLRTLGIYIVLLSGAALILFGLLGSAVATLRLVIFLSTLCLFMVPGVVLVRWFFEEHVSGVAMVPVSFTISVGIFALLGVPFLILHGSLEPYLWIAGAIVAAAVVAAVLKIVRRKPSAENGAPDGFSFSRLWIPFLLLSIPLASMSRLRVRNGLGDMWVYLAWVREFLDAEKLALHEPFFGHQIGASRAQFNGWLLEQAAFSRVSGMDPVNLVLGYLKPVLVVMSLLAFYALAKTLLKSQTAALLASTLYALFFLVNLVPLLGGFGGEFIGRIAEDKFVARFLFFPTALVFAFLFLENRKPRYLLIFAFLCWVVVAIHPIGLAIIGLSTGGFGLVHLAINWRKKEEWIGTLSLGGAILSLLVAPLLYLLVTGDNLLAKLQSANISSVNSDKLDKLDNLVFILRSNAKIFELSGGYYIMHPSLLLNPPILVAVVVGLPFLFWRLRRSLAAQLLAGMLLVSIIVCYVPPVATFIGNHVVSPEQLWRIAWPIPLAAFLTVGWMVWEVTRLAQNGLRATEGPRRLIQVLPLLVVLCALTMAAPASAAGVEKVYGTDEVCSDPIFHWIGGNIKETSVMLAPGSVNICIPAYSSQANVVSLRGWRVMKHQTALNKRVPGKVDVSQVALDVRDFFHRSTLDGKIGIIQSNKVDYVMTKAGSQLSNKLGNLSGFTVMDTPGEKYALFAVNRSKLNRSN